MSIAGAMIVDLLASHRAAFAGVRVEAGKSQTGPLYAEAGAKIAIDHARRPDDQIDAERLRRLGQRDMDRDRHDRERLGPDHHHRKRRLPPRLRQIPQIFGMPGEREAGLVERRLGDRVGDDRPRLAPAHRGDRAGDRFDRRLRVAGVGPAGLRFDRRLERHDRQPPLDHAGSQAGLGFNDRRLDSRFLGDGGHMRRGREKVERRVAQPALAPGEERELGPDPGGLAHCHRQGRLVVRHGLSLPDVPAVKARRSP